jgi:hypothetical protein
MSKTIKVIFNECSSLDGVTPIPPIFIPVTRILVPVTLEYSNVTRYEVRPDVQKDPGQPPGTETFKATLTGELLYKPPHRVKLGTRFPRFAFVPATLEGIVSGEVNGETNVGSGTFYVQNVHVAVYGAFPFAKLNHPNVAIRSSELLILDLHHDVDESVIPIKLSESETMIESRFGNDFWAFTATTAVVQLESPVVRPNSLDYGTVFHRGHILG